MIRPADLIERKRNGEELAPEERGRARPRLRARRGARLPDGGLVHGGLLQWPQRRGDVRADRRDVRSGDTLDLALRSGAVVDKHSTGGVGDKTSIAVGPIVAACGVPVGKMSGRGLGTRSARSTSSSRFPGSARADDRRVIASCATSAWRSSASARDLVPADKKLYALRDVTATVDIVPLIASSIMSKKLAAGADAIVLDVKVGDGAFMKTLDDARVLAEEMLELGRRAGKEVTCLLTDMDHRSAAPSATRSRSARRSTPCAAKAPPTSPSSSSTPAPACSRYSDLGIDVDEGGVAPRRRSTTARPSPPTSAGFGPGRRPDPALAGSVRGRPAPGGRRRFACRRARRRYCGAGARRRPAHEGGRDRPQRRRALLCEAWRRGARRRRPGGGARPGRGSAAAAAGRFSPPTTIADEAPPERGILLDVSPEPRPDRGSPSARPARETEARGPRREPSRCLD